MRKLLIFAAMEMEARAVVEALGGKFVSGENPATIEGRAMAVEVRTIGIRAVRIPNGFSKGDIGGILMAGIAAGLDHTLKVGDVIVDEASEGLPKDLPFRAGKMHTAGELISNPATKLFLFRTNGEIVGEMENQIVRKLAKELGARYWGVRTISDTAEQSLDPRLMELADELGRPRMGVVMKAMLHGPGFIGQMRTMGAQVKIATQKLGEAVKVLVDLWEKQNQG